MERPNVDSMINWAQFYGERVGAPLTPAGQDKLHCCCPFHEERNPSFWVNTTNGMWKCESGCGSGNATSFLARIENISTGEAYAKLCGLAGVETPKGRGKATGRRTGPGYSVREYALEKRLPEDWLRGIGVTDGGSDSIGGFIEIAYFDETGGRLSTRKRYAKGASRRFGWKRGSTPTLYGLWQMEHVRKAGYVVLVEGESDAQTLWHLGLSALGVPGATTFRREWVAALQGVETIYLHVEPDEGGQAFLRKTCDALDKGGCQSVVKAFSCDLHEGCKDPSDVLAKAGEGALRALQGMLKDATVVSLKQAAQQRADNLTDAPVSLAIPPDWRISDEGIEYMDARGKVWERVSWTPILITRILTKHGGGDIKVELAYRRGGRWHTLRCERGVIASSRKIVELAEHGMHVTSENARDVVRYLSELEFMNEGAIPVVPRITHYGWIDKEHFAPGLMDGYYFDKDCLSGKWADIGKAKGDYDAWKAGVGKHRNRAIYRFVVSAGFASPLLRVLGQRIFMIYNWHDSRGGKSATMYAALSIWGDPESIKGNFNTTQVGIERIAGMFCDLPLGIDEKQLAGGDKQDFLQKIVYMLSEGSGKLRGNTKGSLQEQTTWRCIVLASGEEPITVSSSMTGVSTRALEICGRPFDGYEAAEDDAAALYPLTASHHGHAGVDFIQRLVRMDQVELVGAFERMREKLRGMAVRSVRSHISSVAVVAVADWLASMWIWGQDAETAWFGAVGMAREIVGMLQSDEEVDVSERAYRHVLDWVMANRDSFTKHYRAQRLGYFETNLVFGSKEPRAHHALIIPSKLEEELTRARYNYEKTLRWMAEHGHIDVDARGNQKRYRVRRTIEGNRMYLIRLELPTATDDAGFTEVDDAELPGDWEA